MEKVNDNGFNVNMVSQSQKSSSILVNETYSYINNSMFYALAPAGYYNYFYNQVRRYLNWYDGYVPTFHNSENGIFSTGMAHALVDSVANLIVGSKVMLQNLHKETDPNVANNSLKQAYEWADKSKLTSVLRRGVTYAGASGTSLCKLNVKSGNIWIEALRQDDFFFETDFAGELQSVTCLIKSYTDTSSKVKQLNDLKKQTDPKYDSSCDLSNMYYLVESRYFKESKEKVKVVNKKTGEITEVVKKVRVPYVRYAVHQYNGSITNAQLWSPTLQTRLDFKNNVPQHIRKMILDDYSALPFDTEQRLPFADSLGCVLLRYNGGDGSLPQQPFGQSILKNLLSYCMGFDLQYSYMIRDLYQGKGTVFVAKELQTGVGNPNALSGLDESMYTAIPILDDKSGKLPIDKVQFDLRVGEWVATRNAIYESIATQLGISPSSIAGYLSDNTARTAKEVSTESTTTDNYIEIQRGILTPYINDLLKVVGSFYGWQDEVGVRWAKSGTNNMDTLIDRIIKLKSAGLITQYDALKMYMVDADESEIAEADRRLTEFNERQANMQAQMSDRMFGLDYGNEEEKGVNYE